MVKHERDEPVRLRMQVTQLRRRSDGAWILHAGNSSGCRVITWRYKVSASISAALTTSIRDAHFTLANLTPFPVPFLLMILLYPGSEDARNAIRSVTGRPIAALSGLGTYLGPLRPLYGERYTERNSSSSSSLPPFICSFTFCRLCGVTLVQTQRPDFPKPTFSDSTSACFIARRIVRVANPAAAAASRPALASHLLPCSPIYPASQTAA